MADEKKVLRLLKTARGQEAASDAERGQKIDEFVSTLGRILK